MNIPLRLFNQRGVALIMVLFVVALVAVVALSLTKALQPSVVRTANMQLGEQAYWYAVSAEEVVRELLQSELHDNDMVANRSQLWAASSENSQPLPVPGGLIEGTIHDLRACFNLNSLRVPETDAGNNPTEGLLVRRKAQLRMLLLAADDRIDPYAADTVVDSLADWLDADERISGTYGAEDADYESQQFPHQAANTYLSEVSELRLVRGVTPLIYRALEPYVCAWPHDANLAINVNTLAEGAAPLLHAISLGSLSLDDAQRFLENRDMNGFESEEQMRTDRILTQAAAKPIQANFGGGARPTSAALAGLGGALDDLTVKSEYFELKAEITVGDLRIRGRSIVEITPEQTRVLYRSLGD